MERPVEGSEKRRQILQRKQIIGLHFLKDPNMPPKAPQSKPSEDRPAEAGKSPAEGKFKPFSSGVYRSLIAFTLMLGGAGAYELYLDQRNPDPRTPEEMARAYYTYRPMVIGKKPGTPSDERVKASAKNAVCLLNQMCHPLGDSYKGKGKKECKRESDDFFIDRHDPGDPQKYVYWPKLHDYVHEKRPDLVFNALSSLRQDKTGKSSIRWFTDKYNVFKKGKTGPDKDIFKEFVEIFLRQRLKCVRAVGGGCIKTFDGSDCLLFADLADEVTRANFAMHADGKGELKPSVCFRTSLHQAIAYVDIGNQGCKMVGSRPGGQAVSAPGNSAHAGLAMDLPNYAAAEDYLSKIGMGCDQVEGDPGHCSFGEVATQEKLKSVYQKVRRVIREGVDIISDRIHRRGSKKK